MTFEEWLRTVCFQPPTPEAKDLAKCAWDHQGARVAELEALLGRAYHCEVDAEDWALCKRCRADIGKALGI